jgi:hypothetical protein
MNNATVLAQKQALTNVQEIFLGWPGSWTVDVILHEAPPDPRRIGRRA